MKLVSYNIQYGLGQDGIYNVERIADVIRHADIIALQEVERYWQRSGMMDQAAVLSGLLPEHYGIFAANLDMHAGFKDSQGRLVSRRRQFGTMILSRYPILSSRNFPLPKIGTLTQHSIQQGLQETVIDSGSGAVRVYSTHLSHLCADTRLPQVRYIKQVLQAAPIEGGAWCGGHPDPEAGWTEGKMPPMPQELILMGDLNFAPSSQEYTELTGPQTARYGRLLNHGGLVDAWVAAGHDENDGITYPDGERIDHCFISPGLQQRVRSAWIDDSAIASDHWPLWVELDHVGSA